MKLANLTIPAIVAVIILTACAKQTAPASRAVDMEKYTSKNEHFSVLVPGKPVEQADDSDPNQPHYFYFQVNEKNYRYLISSGKSGVGQTNLDAFFDQVRDKTVAQYGGLLKERPVSVCGFPGRELQLATDNGHGFAVTRYFVGQGRFYQMVVLVPREDRDSTNLSLFLDSFSLLDVK